MIKLLQFEWRKLWRQKSLYICFGFGLLIILLTILSLKIYGILEPACNMMYMILNSGFVAFLGIFVALFICQDYNQQTIKNIYARGYSRSAVFFSKYLISLFVTVFMALVYLLFTFLCSVILGSSVGSLAGWQWGVMALQFWTLIGFHAMFFGMSMMIGKIGGSVALNLVGINFAFVILELIFSVLEIDFKIQNFNLQNLFTALFDTIFYLAMPTKLLLRAIFLPLSYSVIFITAGWFVNYRREV